MLQDDPRYVAARSVRAAETIKTLTRLQSIFASGLDELSTRFGDGERLKPATWLRDEGAHGGGWRREGTDLGVLNRGSLNISSVHYDDLPEKRLSSATALSCIVHPQHPRASSLHTHISWTELRDGSGGWRLMADLNPSIAIEEQRARFLSEVSQSLTPLDESQRQHARDQGDRYFWIPSLKRHRGVAHFYLEQWNSGDFEADLALAERFGACVIKTYLGLIEESLSAATVPTEEERRAQLEYHSAYLLQVLTLDRGTSSGLLVHNQNDVGILGSLPQRVSRAILREWIPAQPELQGELLSRLIDALPQDHEGDPLEVATLTAEVRARLASAVRTYLRDYPEALKLQARGDILPPTVAHHESVQSSR